MKEFSWNQNRKVKKTTENLSGFNQDFVIFAVKLKIRKLFLKYKGGLKAVILAILLYCFHSLEAGERSASKGI